jgi:transposase InsO family protein
VHKKARHDAMPTAIQVEDGTEFTSRVLDQWAYQNQVALHFIDRGKPTQNAFIESFNFRDVYQIRGLDSYRRIEFQEGCAIHQNSFCTQPHRPRT